MRLITSIILLISILVVYSFAQENNKVSQLGFFEKGNINGFIFYQCGRVSDFNKQANGSLDYTSPVSRFKSSMGVNLGIHLFEYWYFRTTLFYNLNKNINAPWVNTDYTYCLERTRWDYNSFSYGYANYQINKYNEIGKDFLDSFFRGYYYFRFFTKAPENMFKSLGAKKPFQFNYYFTLSYAVRYWDNENNIKGGLFNGKPVLSFNARYIFWKAFYIEGSANYFPVHKTKVTSDADFTYGFGYNKYTNFSIGISYGNYSVNRFPWNEKPVEGYGFLDGNFTLQLNYRW